MDETEDFLNGKYFNLSYFLCLFCGENLIDPVTLSCGHSYSRKCAILNAEANGGFFTCYRCENCSYSIGYITALKNNIVMSSVIRNFWNSRDEEAIKYKRGSGLTLKHNYQGCKCEPCKIDVDKNEMSATFDAIICFIENSTPYDCVRNGCKLVNLDRFQEAIHHFFVCSVFSPDFIEIKANLNYSVHRYLMECSKSSEKSPGYFTVPDSSELKSDINIQENSSEKCVEPAVGHNMCKLINKLCDDLDKITGVNFVKKRFSTLSLDRDEFDCVLCMRMLLDPFTTPCGHTFCRSCYNRCLDYQTDCPLCKSILVRSYRERVQNIDEFAELVLKIKYKDDYSEREKSYLSEMHRLLNAGNSPEDELPLFVCTIAFPTVPCPLHIFEPRYRHMIRKCVESGSNKFGMCAYIENDTAKYGTFLEIKKVDYLDDGRSIVKTVGGDRFHILKKGQGDGYQTAFVKRVKDEILPIDSMPDIEQFHNNLYKVSESWFYRLPKQTRDQILQHFGAMPGIEPNDLRISNGPSWMWWMLATLPIEQKSLVSILSMTSVFRRLKTLEKIILHLDPSIYSLMK